VPIPLLPLHLVPSAIKQRRKPPRLGRNATRRRKPQPRRRRPLPAGAPWGLRPPPPCLATGDHRRRKVRPLRPGSLPPHFRASLSRLVRAAGQCGASSAPGPGTARPPLARAAGARYSRKKSSFFLVLCLVRGEGFVSPCALAAVSSWFLLSQASSSSQMGRWFALPLLLCLCPSDVPRWGFVLLLLGGGEFWGVFGGAP
jgi:hypothetical protein